MQSKGAKLLETGVTIFIILGCLAVLILCVRHLIYVGYCWGKLGEDSLWLRYFFQCSCPPSTENIRFQKLYSEDVEVMFPACESASIGPIPSPDGHKVAVINFEEPDESYVWFLQTSEKASFTWPGGGDLIWLSDSLLFVQWGLDTARVMDLNARTEYPIPVRTDVRLADDRIAPDVLSALQKAGYVLLAGGEVAAISPDALFSPEHSFVIRYDEFGYERHNLNSIKQMRQFLRDQDIAYLDYIDSRGTDVLLSGWFRKYEKDEIPSFDLVSPDGRFFYRKSFRDLSEDGIYLVETGEKIVDRIPGWVPVGWVHDGVIIQYVGHDYLIHFFVDMGGAYLCEIYEPWLKLRVPAEYLEYK